MSVSNISRKEELMPVRNYSEDYKKKVIRLKLQKCISFKSLSVMTGVCVASLCKWHDEYYYEVMHEIAEESRKRRSRKYKKTVIWHQYGSGAGRFE